jgi:hypothetical protein
MEIKIMKPSEFLKRYEGHGIYNHEKLSQKFKELVGDDPCWPTHTVKETSDSIEGDYRGGHVEGKPEQLVVYGYELADAIAKRYANYSSWKMGRGSAYRDCQEQLAKAGK